MNREFISTWLQTRLNHARQLSLLGAAWSLVGGVLILLGTFVLAFAVTWFISSAFFHLSNWTCLALALGFLALVIVSGLMRRRDLQVPLSYPRPDFTQDMHVERTVALVTNFEPGAVYKTRAAASFGDSLFCGGVHMLLDALAEWRHATRLREVNTSACAAAVAFLMTEDRRVPLAELAARLDGLDPRKVFDDLRYVEGIQILLGEPAGFALQPDFRSELFNAARG